MIAFSAEEMCRHATSLRALARDLLADAALAEDAVQQAYVTALTRPPPGPVALAAWLRSVVRSCALDLRRSEHRRRQREQRSASAETGEGSGAAERLELQQDIVAAVRALDEPYRTAVWMRYYEDLSPSAIARALGEPVKTVKTRLWRALQLLRQRLDGRYGDRRAWLGALMPLAHGSSEVFGLGAAGAAGALLMQAKNLVVAAIVAVLFAGGAALMWPGGAPPPAPTTALPIPAGDASARTERPSSVGDVPLRQLALPTTSPTAPYGSLLVRVRWHDGTPAPEVAIDFLAEGEPQLDRNEIRVVSDAAGVVRAARLHAGAVKLSSDRGGRVVTDVVAGTTREVDFTLPRGIDVTGAVEDEHRRPVAGAQVVLVSQRGGWLGGRVVAVTGTEGTFAVRAVDPTWSLGARAAGFAPSVLVDLETVERPAAAISASIRLQLQHPGACVAGRVVDEAGTAIAGAVVVLGRGGGGHHDGGRIRESWSPHVVSTAGDGSFRCDGVEPGAQPLVAWAEGCTRATGTVQCIAGETASVTLALARGIAVRGTVRDEAGAVVADAIVMGLAAPVVDEPFDYVLSGGRSAARPQTRSDVEGRFLLRGVPPGDLHLVAAKRRNFANIEGVCQATLSGRAGDELTWDPVLVAGKTLRVRVVDAEGKPVFLGKLDAYAEQPAGPASSLSAFPERKPVGLHVFTDCADVPYTIVARVLRMGGESRWAYLRGVRPGDPDVELRLPPIPPAGEPGEVTGRIADAGRRLEGRSLSVSLCTSAMIGHPEVKGDRFLAKDVLTGRYFIRVRAGDDTILIGPWFELQPGQHLDLGDLVTEPGAGLRVALRAPAGADLGKPAAALDRGFHWRPLLWDGKHLVATNLTVGRHRLTLTTPGWHAPPRDLELVAGVDNLVTLDVVPATQRTFELVLPLPEQWQRCDFTLRDAAGNALSELLGLTSAGVGLRPYPWRASQPFGRFTLEAVLDGQRRTWPVDLREPVGADLPLRFSLH